MICYLFLGSSSYSRGHVMTRFKLMQQKEIFFCKKKICKLYYFLIDKYWNLLEGIYGTQKHPWPQKEWRSYGEAGKKKQRDFCVVVDFVLLCVLFVFLLVYLFWSFFCFFFCLLALICFLAWGGMAGMRGVQKTRIWMESG